jgi:hypothetical protein
MKYWQQILRNFIKYVKMWGRQVFCIDMFLGIKVGSETQAEVSRLWWKHKLRYQSWGGNTR